MLNAFCVDTEEWFHVCGVTTPYSDPATWEHAPSQVVRNTDVLLKILDDAGVRGTFLCLGWVADQHPSLIRRIAEAGHEIGCHGYAHQLVYTMTPDEFERDLRKSLAILRDLSGQPVSVYRAPSFSITDECFWAYPILIRNGIKVDVSLVPARRDNGGVEGVSRDPFLLETFDGRLKCFPVSVMTLLGRTIPFSGGGYLRVLPQPVINAGFRQNHREKRVGMSYIHPREIDPNQPRLSLPLMKSFKYYVNLRTTQRKLRHLLRRFRFSTVEDVIASVEHWPEYTIANSQLVLNHSSGFTSELLFRPPAEDASPAAGTRDNSYVPNEGETAVQPPQPAELSTGFVAAPESVAAAALSVDPTAPAEVQPSFATAGREVSRQTEPEVSTEAVPAATSGQKTAVSEAAIGSVAGPAKSEPVPAVRRVMDIIKRKPR